MPDADGKLDEQEKKKAIDWLNKKATNHVCPSCASNNWTIGDHLLNSMPFTGGGIIIGGPSYPMAFIVCNNCAYIRHYMAVPMGILPSTQSSGEEGGKND